MEEANCFPEELNHILQQLDDFTAFAADPAYSSVDEKRREEFIKEKHILLNSLSSLLITLMSNNPRDAARCVKTVKGGEELEEEEIVLSFLCCVSFLPIQVDNTILDDSFFPWSHPSLSILSKQTIHLINSLLTPSPPPAPSLLSPSLESEETPNDKPSPNCTREAKKKDKDEEGRGEDETLVLISFLPKLFSKLHFCLKNGSKRIAEEEEGKLFTTLDTKSIRNFISAHRMAWCILMLKNEEIFFNNVQFLMPCILVSLDHDSSQVKILGMLSLCHASQFLSRDQLEIYAYVAMDAMCQNMIGCDSLTWRSFYPLSLDFFRILKNKKTKSKWVLKYFEFILLEMEKNSKFKNASNQKIFLENGKKLFDLMGLTLTAYLKKLFSVFFSLLRLYAEVDKDKDKEEDIILLILDDLKSIFLICWARISLHLRKIIEELSWCYSETKSHKSFPQIKSKIREIFELLHKIEGPQFEKKFKLVTKMESPDIFMATI